MLLVAVGFHYTFKLSQLHYHPQPAVPTPLIGLNTALFTPYWHTLLYRPHAWAVIKSQHRYDMWLLLLCSIWTNIFTLCRWKLGMYRCEQQHISFSMATNFVGPLLLNTSTNFFDFSILQSCSYDIMLPPCSYNFISPYINAVVSASVATRYQTSPTEPQPRFLPPYFQPTLLAYSQRIGCTLTRNKTWFKGE